MLDKAITLRSVSGTMANPAVIVGAYHNPAGGVTNGTAAIRCLYVSAPATVIGLQLTNGATSAATGHGGGAYLTSSGAGTLFSNCVITANSAAGYGGGVYGVTPTVLARCLIRSNYAVSFGGGAYGATLRQCDIVDNGTSPAGGYGGGMHSGSAEFCRFVGNYARVGGGVYSAAVSDSSLISNRCVWAGGGEVFVAPPRPVATTAVNHQQRNLNEKSQR